MVCDIHYECRDHIYCGRVSKAGRIGSSSFESGSLFVGCGGAAAALPIVDGIGAGWAFNLVTGVMFSSLALVLLQLRLGSRKSKGRERRERDSAKETLGESSNS
jgi:hypothetical protein